MKRLAPLLLTLVLLFGILAGCAASRQSPASPVPAETAVPGTAAEEAAASEPPNLARLASVSDFFLLFLDVGQADSILVGCEGHYMLVDGGNVADSQRVVSVLKKYGVKQLDELVCTHGHEDHVGGLTGVLYSFPVREVLCPITHYNSDPFRNFRNAVKSAGLSLTRPMVDLEFSLGSASVKVLAPRRDNYEDPNDFSLVLKLTYGANTFLLTGDAERASELDMVEDGCDLKSDVLKVGHHGSNSSTSYPFLNAVMPTWAVVSAGQNNDFGHPAEAPLSRLRDAQAALLRTDMQGDILCVSDGTAITFTPARHPNAITNPTRMDGLGSNAAPGSYIGNLRTGVFHRATCPNLPAADNRAYFRYRTEAIVAGFRPCGVCTP